MDSEEKAATCPKYTLGKFLMAKGGAKIEHHGRARPGRRGHNMKNQRQQATPLLAFGTRLSQLQPPEGSYHHRKGIAKRLPNQERCMSRSTNSGKLPLSTNKDALKGVQLGLGKETSTEPQTLPLYSTPTMSDTACSVHGQEEGDSGNEPEGEDETPGKPQQLGQQLEPRQHQLKAGAAGCSRGQAALRDQLQPNQPQFTTLQQQPIPSEARQQQLSEDNAVLTGQLAAVRLQLNSYQAASESMEAQMYSLQEQAVEEAAYADSLRYQLAKSQTADLDGQVQIAALQQQLSKFQTAGNAAQAHTTALLQQLNLSKATEKAGQEQIMALLQQLATPTNPMVEQPVDQPQPHTGGLDVDTAAQLLTLAQKQQVEARSMLTISQDAESEAQKSAMITQNQTSHWQQQWGVSAVACATLSQQLVLAQQQRASQQLGSESFQLAMFQEAALQVQMAHAQTGVEIMRGRTALWEARKKHVLEQQATTNIVTVCLHQQLKLCTMVVQTLHQPFIPAQPMCARSAPAPQQVQQVHKQESASNVHEIQHEMQNMTGARHPPAQQQQLQQHTLAGTQLAPPTKPVTSPTHPFPGNLSDITPDHMLVDQMVASVDAPMRRMAPSLVFVDAQSVDMPHTHLEIHGATVPSTQGFHQDESQAELESKGSSCLPAGLVGGSKRSAHVALTATVCEHLNEDQDGAQQARKRTRISYQVPADPSVGKRLVHSSASSHTGPRGTTPMEGQHALATGIPQQQGS